MTFELTAEVFQMRDWMFMLELCECVNEMYFEEKTKCVKL